MPLAIALIVDGYVRLGDRAALEALRVHRLAMLDAAAAIAELDVSAMTTALKDEIAIIETGLAQLDGQREPEMRASDRLLEGPPPRDGGSAV